MAESTSGANIPGMNDDQGFVNSPISEGLVMRPYERYDDESYWASFPEEAGERYYEVDEMFRELTEENPGLFNPNYGKWDVAKFYNLTTRHVVVPKFLERAKGQQLRPEAIANHLFKAIEGVEPGDVETIIPEESRVSVARDVNEMGIDNYRNELREAVYDPKNLGPLVGVLLHDSEPKVAQAVYAVIKANTKYMGPEIPLERFEEIAAERIPTFNNPE